MQSARPWCCCDLAWILRARPSGCSVEHKRFHWTSASHKAILWIWWVKTSRRPCYNHVLTQVKTCMLPKSQNIQHSPLQATGNDCWCFTNYSFSLPLVCLPTEIWWYTQSSHCPRFRPALKPEWTPASLGSPPKSRSQIQILNKSFLIFSYQDAPQFPMMCLFKLSLFSHWYAPGVWVEGIGSNFLEPYFSSYRNQE